eukprot:49720-Pyramimonas_sp.AAC.1
MFPIVTKLLLNVALRQRDRRLTDQDVPRPTWHEKNRSDPSSRSHMGKTSRRNTEHYDGTADRHGAGEDRHDQHRSLR